MRDKRPLVADFKTTGHIDNFVSNFDIVQRNLAKKKSKSL